MCYRRRQALYYDSNGAIVQAPRRGLYSSRRQPIQPTVLYANPPVQYPNGGPYYPSHDQTTTQSNPHYPDHRGQYPNDVVNNPVYNSPAPIVGTVTPHQPGFHTRRELRKGRETLAGALIRGISSGSQKPQGIPAARRAERAVWEPEPQYAGGSATRSDRSREEMDERYPRSKSEEARRERYRSRSVGAYSDGDYDEREAPPPSYDTVYTSPSQGRPRRY